LEGAGDQSELTVQLNPGLSLHCGIGVPANPSGAARYSKLAADQPHLLTQFVFNVF
jgi:hypothetical protein